MPTPTTKRLQALQKKAFEKGQWPLASSAYAALADEAMLDHQINVPGAMHEVGLLRNSMEPYWKVWRTDPAAWAGRCVERLRTVDFDYWALAALLAMDIRDVWPVCKKEGYKVTSVRAVGYCPPLLTAASHVITIALDGNEGRWLTVLEFGWDAKTGEINDVTRARVVSFRGDWSRKGASTIGKGKATNFMRATLPYGGWRMLTAPFELAEENVIPIEQTLLKKA